MCPCPTLDSSTSLLVLSLSNLEVSNSSVWVGQFGPFVSGEFSQNRVLKILSLCSTKDLLLLFSIFANMLVNPYPLWLDLMLSLVLLHSLFERSVVDKNLLDWVVQLTGTQQSLPNACSNEYTAK